MAKTHRFKLRRQLSEDAAGVVYQAQDQAGRRVELRKFTGHAKNGAGLEAVEEVAYQVAVERLSRIAHPSLRKLSFGGCDPQDGTPYVATKPADGQPLEDFLAHGPLPVEMATMLLSQLLELCELVSHTLADEGVWVETQPANIIATGKGAEMRFIFWPSPVKALQHSSQNHDFSGVIELTEAVVDSQEAIEDGEECSHLQAWLQWLKEVTASDEGATIREAREMLAAAAGVEPPPPIEVLIDQSQQARRRGDGLRKLISAMKVPAPKMPLFALLSVMFVAQAIFGWLWVRKINDNIDNRLQDLKNSIYDSPYTANRDPERAAEVGSQPLDFDE